MAVRYYPAVIEQAQEGFGVFFPDLPGCTSGGDTIEEAVRNAEEAARGHIEILVEDGESVPAPSDLRQIVLEPGVNAVAQVLVRVEMPGRAVRVNITLPEDLLAAVDSHAQRRGFSRSGFLAQAAREALKRDREAA